MSSGPWFLGSLDSGWIMPLALLLLQLAEGGSRGFSASVNIWANFSNKSLLTSVCLSICLSIWHLSIHSSMYLSFLSILSPIIHPSIISIYHLSIFLSSLHPFIHVSVYHFSLCILSSIVCPFIHLSSLSIYLPVYLSIYLSIYLSSICTCIYTPYQLFFSGDPWLIRSDSRKNPVPCVFQRLEAAHISWTMAPFHLKAHSGLSSLLHAVSLCLWASCLPPLPTWAYMGNPG